jgi:hypothetical protein
VFIPLSVSIPSFVQYHLWEFLSWYFQFIIKCLFNECRMEWLFLHKINFLSKWGLCKITSRTVHHVRINTVKPRFMLFKGLPRTDVNQGITNVTAWRKLWSSL